MWRWQMGASLGRARGRPLPRFLPFAVVFVLLMTAWLAVATNAASSSETRIRAGTGPPLQVFSRPPVLVRAGEPVQIPVDVVCTTAAGRTCGATATLWVRDTR